MNFLVAQGHIHAGRYTLGRLWSEKEITVRRLNVETANRATVDKTAQGAIHGGKKGHELFKGLIKKLTGG